MGQVHDDYLVQLICGYVMGNKRIQPPCALGYRNNFLLNIWMQASQILNLYAMASAGKRGARLNTANFLEVSTLGGRDALALSVAVEVPPDGYGLLSGFIE